MHPLVGIRSPPEPETESYHQIAKIDEPFLVWNFTLRDGNGREIASVSRAFRDFGREVYTEALRLVQVLIYADFHRYVYGAPWSGWGVGLKNRHSGRYTIRSSPAERQVIVNSMICVTREKGQETSLNERAGVANRCKHNVRCNLEPSLVDSCNSGYATSCYLIHR
jgi:hypothetical protein